MVGNSEDKEDRIYAERVKSIPAFQFDEKVSEVFDNMIARSVPGYDTVRTFFPLLVKKFAKANSYVYDLGCSTGKLSQAILQNSQAQVIAVDNSQAMLNKAKENIVESSRISFQCEDIMQLTFLESSLMVMNYTLQFIKLEQRDEIIERIYQALEEGGAFVMTEKIAIADDKEAQIARELHEEFKRLHGYSDLEISQKRSALEQVLVPETIEVHIERLKKAGFVCPFIWFRSLNFVSFLAVK